MDPGWFVLFLFLMIELFFVTLLCMPMPSNKVRGRTTKFVTSIWDNQAVQYATYFILAVDVVYFYFVFDALAQPLHDLGILSPVEMGVSCEQKQDLFYNERNAYISGMSIFLFFVLNRLVDIQSRLYTQRETVKRQSQSQLEVSKKSE